MSTADEVIRRLIREELEDFVKSNPPEVELISMAEAAKICGVSKQVIQNLSNAAPANGFPSIRLGERAIKIDKRRLTAWFQSGGLTE